MRSLLLAADEESGLPVYVYVFWTGFIVYMIWYGLRLYRKMSDRRAERAEPLPPIPPSPAAGPSTARSTTSRGPSAGGSTAAPFATRTPTAPEPSDREPPNREPSSREPSSREPSSREPSNGGWSDPARAGAGTTGSEGSSRTGFFAAGSDDDRPPDRIRRPVATVLQGITMPDELAPVVNPESNDLSGLRVAFSAIGADPGRVGRAVGDELERLGFALQSLGDTQLGAQRDDDELVVTIYTDPTAVERLGAKAFPVLPAGTFVVEFESV